MQSKIIHKSERFPECDAIEVRQNFTDVSEVRTASNFRAKVFEAQFSDV
jgi:hypothetical protein